MLKKLFGSRKVPTNGGGDVPSAGLGEMRLVKRFELELSNMEGSPVYAITNQLTVGSEIGNIVISDPSISPRHATFLLQEEVIAIIDHGSVSGTMVNGKKIPSGRYILLEETDVIKIGDLDIKIKVSTESVPADSIPDLPEETPVEEETSPPPEAVNKNIQKEKKQAAVRQANSKKRVSFEDNRAANTLVRISAVLVDLLLATGLYIILLPFDEFRSMVEDLPVLILDLLGIDFKLLLEQMSKDYGFIVEMFEGAWTFMGSIFNPLPLLVMFFIIRLVTTLIFGVSAGELLLFVKARGNAVWKRIGGGIRVLLGVITGPLIITDLPAIISRRTLKEVLTFTGIYTPSKVATIFCLILILPLALSFALIAPMFQGMELPRSVQVNSQLEQRVKVANPQGEGSAATPVTLASNFLGMKLEIDSATIGIMPQFKFQGQKKKINITPRATFYSRELQRSVSVELMKNFDFKQLVGFAMRGNFFLYDKYPELYNFVYEDAQNPALKPREDEKAQARFATELMSFTKVALELDANNVLEVMQEQTLLLKGLLDFKNSLLALLEYKDFEQISFIKAGNTIFMRVVYQKSKPFDLIIPLIKGRGRVFRVEYDKLENVSTLTSSFYKFMLEKSDWLDYETKINTESLNSLNVLDVIHSTVAQDHGPSEASAQGLYGYYYEQSAEVLRRADPVEIELWKKSTESFFKVVEKMHEIRVEGAEGTESLSKLYQNVRDLVDALENQNLEYFSITTTTKV